MAQKVQIELVDDLDGTPAAETVPFGFGGKSYEIDLSKENAETFREQMEEYIAYAREAGAAVPGPRRDRRNKMTRDRTQHVRKWAREHGHELSDRGRIPVRVQEQYDEAHA